MKKLILSFLAIVMVVSFSNQVMGQATASATATATIIAPITITQTGDMNFGNVTVQAGTAGTVILVPAGTRTTTSGVTLPATTGTIAAATFTIGGEGAYTYAITLPTSDYTITRVSGTETMAVNTFSSTPSSTGALSSGTQTLTVGATLNVSAAQVVGTYTNATGFDVTVNYN